MGKKPLVLIDIDETLVDTNYQFNDDSLAEAVQLAQAAGWEVGLNSDTPLPRLSNMASQFGMQGVLVAELGGVIGDNGPPTPPRKLWEDASFWSIFHDLRYRLMAHARQKFPNAIVTDGNMQEVRRVLMACEHPEEQVWIIFHGQREYSLAFYALKFGPQGMSFDAEILEELSKTGEQIFIDEVNWRPVVDVNMDYGLCIIHRTKARKGNALRQLRRQFSPIVMVGNSMSDFMGRHVEHCAVANASDDFKARAVYTASEPLTKGVIEILGELSRREF